MPNGMELSEEPPDSEPEELEAWDEALALEVLSRCDPWCSPPAALSPIQERLRAWEEIGHYEQREGDELLDLRVALEEIERASIRVPLALVTELVLGSRHTDIRQEVLRALTPRHAPRRERTTW